MQYCFREHPDIYAAELEDENEPQSLDTAKEEGKGPSDSKTDLNSEDKPLDQPPAPLERPAEKE
jgi:hypothetical protein